MTPPHSHGVRDLVISCIDYRFRALIATWIKNELNDQADLVSVAGAAKAELDDASRDYVIGLITIARDLHGVTTVHLLNHVDCGAYGGSKQHATAEHEKHFHAAQCALATQVITAHFPELTVKSYLVDFDGVHPVAEPAAAPATV